MRFQTEFYVNTNEVDRPPVSFTVVNAGEASTKGAAYSMLNRGQNQYTGGQWTNFVSSVIGASNMLRPIRWKASAKIHGFPWLVDAKIPAWFFTRW